MSRVGGARLLGAAAVLVALGVSGCTPGTGVGDGAGRDAASALVAATPAADETSAELPVGVIGTAHVTGLDGGDLGLVELVADGTFKVEVRLSGFTADPANPRQVIFSPYQLDADQTCFDEGLRVDVGSPDRPDGWSGVLYVGDFMVGDPSFLEEVVLTTSSWMNQFGSNEPVECAADVVGRGLISWTFEPLRSGLVAVDSGSTGGAQGPVEVAEDGAAIAYTVVSNDLIDEVAARFGLTADDLFYLNPERLPSPQRVTLLQGEVLNLSLDRR